MNKTVPGKATQLRYCIGVTAAALAFFVEPVAEAENLNIQAVMSPKEQIRLDFKDSTGHFLLMVHREGVASGTGILSKSTLNEYGRHDIVPGVSGDPSGYLVATDESGNNAYIKWTVRTLYLPGKDGKPEMHDNGFWEIVSGTGQLQGLKDAGTLHIKTASTTERLFSLEGETSLP